MAGKKGQQKRFWADEEKRSICAQATAPGVSVVQVARRYAMNANLIFKWLKYPRFSPATGETLGGSEDGSVFLPVQISGHSSKMQRRSGLSPNCKLLHRARMPVCGAKQSSSKLHDHTLLQVIPRPTRTKMAATAAAPGKPQPALIGPMTKGPAKTAE